MDSIYLLQLVVAVLVLGLLARSLSRHFKTPVIVFLLAEGVIIGPEMLNLLDPSVFGDGLTAIVSLSVAIIVFDGGLHIDLRQIRTIQKSVLKLTTIGVLITFILATVITHIFLGVDLKLAALFGALITATGPTVITPIVRNLRVNHKVSKILELEGVLNDAACVILAAVVFEWIVSQLSGMEAIGFIAYRVFIGIFMGTISGVALDRFLTKGPVITEQTARLVTLTFVIATFVIAESFGNESGILAVALFGIIMGTSKTPYQQAIKDFKSDLVFMMLSLIFIFLAAMLKFDDIVQIGAGGVAVVILLIVLIRPIAVFASTIGARISTGEKLFISFVDPRGVVPASVAMYFALKLDVLGIGGGQMLVGLVFFTVVITVVMTGTLSKYVANLLGVIPMEIIIVGGGEVGRILAERFEKRGENVVVIDTSEENCQKLLKKGIRAVHGDAGDVNVLEKAGIKHAKYIVTTTDQDNTNLLVCQIAKSKYGFKEEQLVARVNNIDNMHAFWDLEIRSMSPAMTTAVVLDNMVGRPNMFSMCEVGDEGEILEVKVTNPKVAGKAIKDLSLPEKSLLMMVRRGDQSIIAHGNLVLQFDDMVTVIGEGDAAKLVSDILMK
ncbi:MAG: cation:proton antiporter [Methanosarcinaceae archaeon]|nr:cation:proton antiporter [Methanosarcinaceae archaeon]MDF1533643.1 cation:proton antiporter [Methanosarcinaceae archaeon]